MSSMACAGVRRDAPLGAVVVAGADDCGCAGVERQARPSTKPMITSKPKAAMRHS